MRKPSTRQKQRNGVFYTPELLARALATPLINRGTRSVFDPSCGDGRLLHAAYRASRSRQGFRSAISFSGCDRALPHTKRTLGTAKLVRSDFIDYRPSTLFDVILMNPPFVRHHRLSRAQRAKCQAETASLLKVKQTSDLWAYFVLKAARHLRNGGSIGAILPWSFLSADYAKPLRIWLAERFSEIRVKVLSGSHFDDTKERVIIVWLKGYGTPASKISLEYSDDIHATGSKIPISSKDWAADTVVAGTQGQNIQKFLKRNIFSAGFTHLENHAKIRIGVVTGANEFFVLSRSAARRIAVQSDWRSPILSSAREFHALHFNGYRPPSLLIHFPKDPQKESIKSYLASGKRKKLHLRTHSQPRKPWFRLRREACPNAFFPYRVTDTPFMALNDSGLQSTNSIHRLYFKNLTTNQAKWLQVALLAAPSQLFFEARGRIYGNGILKLEPGILKRAPVLVSSKPLSIKAYRKIESLIIAGKRQAAVAAASQLIYKTAGIQPRIQATIDRMLLDLKLRRSGRGFRS